jgi:dipeptide/tripeptide permease
MLVRAAHDDFVLAEENAVGLSSMYTDERHTVSVYVVGVFMAAGAVYPTFSSGPMFLVAMFCFIAPGTGGMKPNVPSFGSDQFDPSIPREARHQEMWWSYFYWAVNLGAAVVFGYLTTLTTSGGGIITKEYGYVKRKENVVKKK